MDSGTYRDELIAYAAEQTRLHRLAKESSAQPTAHRERAKPLDQQIQEFMRSTPPALLQRPWSMSELVARLSGKYRDRPHSQQVGQSLRRLAWTTVRRWGKGFDGTRLWLPPLQSEQNPLQPTPRLQIALAPERRKLQKETGSQQ